MQFKIAGRHDVTPLFVSGMSDRGLVVGVGETKCLQFTETGTFEFFCSVHGLETGSITVRDQSPSVGAASCVMS